VVADLAGSRRNARLKAYPDPIHLQFGDPHDRNTWAPAGPARLVPGLYSLQDDWAVLELDGPAPAGVTPLRLADLAVAHDQVTWKTFGFPDVAAHVGGDFDGPITSWETRTVRLRSDAATGVRMRGISGAPCVVNGDIVALIDSALLEDERCQGGVLLAVQARSIAAAAGGRLPFAQPVPVPFEHRVRALLPRDNDAAVHDAARLLGIPERPTPGDVARGLVLAGVARAGAILWEIAVPETARHEVIDMVAAAQLHHEAVDRLVEATRSALPGLVRATAEETCNWYGLRARHQLTVDGDATAASSRAAGMWGNRLLHVDVAGHEESPAPAGDADPVEAAADQLIELIRKAAARRWANPRAVQTALDGKLAAPFCVALHGELRVPVVAALRRRLPNAHFLMVCPGEVVLAEADRARVVTIAPHLENESDLLDSYHATRTA
jgi:hypothetical protein